MTVAKIIFSFVGGKRKMKDDKSKVHRGNLDKILSIHRAHKVGNKINIEKKLEFLFILFWQKNLLVL